LQLIQESESWLDKKSL